MIMVAVVAELLEECAEVMMEIFAFTEQQLDSLVSNHRVSTRSSSSSDSPSSSSSSAWSSASSDTDRSSFLFYF
uniref:Uncharacterized protein n=1 Tax=Kalanchoe fedtschenkoi TaxID=63787 RepID=A0A7N0RDN2_KALFE